MYQQAHDTNEEQRERLCKAGFRLLPPPYFVEHWVYGDELEPTDFVLRTIKGELRWSVSGAPAPASVHLAFVNALYPPDETAAVTDEEMRSLVQGDQSP